MSHVFMFLSIGNGGAKVKLLKITNNIGEISAKFENVLYLEILFCINDLS